MNLETELESEIQRQLLEGIKFARAGEKGRAEEVFFRILSVTPDYEDALVWRAAVTEDRAEAVRCLTRVLQLNPENRRAQAGIEWAERRLKEYNNRNLFSSSARSSSKESPAKSSKETGLEPEELNLSDKPSTKAIPPFSGGSSSALPKNETKQSTAPYKTSRFQNEAAALILPPEALQQVPGSRQEKPNKLNLKPSKSGDEVPRAKGEYGGLLTSASPKVALSVSEKVGLGKPVDTTQRRKIRVSRPLMLFVLALAVALLTFVLPALGPILGVLALIFAAAGVVLFNQADF